ncbi:MAG: T9SS type A sorting domain-containing protein [Flavobacteriales bacterium]|nr:T9SS type A sorting domain-containing protein [Flavobacteriales bacterium]
MKKNYLFLLGAFVSLQATSQVVIQANEVNPVAGDVFTLKYVDWISEGNAGSNVTWDFSGLQETGATQSNNYTSNSSSSFPAATVALEASAGGQSSTTYLETTASEQNIQGIETSSVVFDYQTPQKILVFPLDNTVNEMSSFQCTFTSGGFPFTRSGTMNITVDGYGTLITPEGTFTDVVRVKHTMVYSDVYAGGTIDYDQTVYMWYKAGVHQSLLLLSELSSNIAPTQYSAHYLSNVNVGLDEQVPSTVAVYPNPSSSLINIEVEEGSSKVESVVLMDMTGKTVGSELLNNGTAQMHIDHLQNGVYFATLVGENGRKLVTKKVIKE